MKKSLLLICGIILLVLVVGQAIALFFFYSKNEDLEKKVVEFEDSKFEKLSFIESLPRTNPNEEFEEISAIQKEPKDISEVAIGGWIPDWDNADGLATVQTYANDFDFVSPFYFDLNPDGTLKELAGANSSELYNLARNNDIEYIPTITCFNADTLREALTNNMDKHIDEIMNQVLINDWDGVDLDYESMYFDDKELFFEFLQKLAIELNQENRKFVFTVQPKWGNSSTIYLSFPETRAVQDYQRISDIVDELRIMTYEYSGRSTKFYGPNAPIGWMEYVVQYAIWSGVPRDKIVLGIPTYSYDYTLRDKMENIKFLPILRFQGDDSLDPGVAYYNETVDEVIDNYDYEEEYEEDWQEMVLRYQFEGEDRVIVYPNNDSIRARIQLAADYGIKGVAYWRLGDEGRLDLVP